jgi:SAM-dependent methyltransferase
LKNSNLTAIEQQIWKKLNPQKVTSDVGRYERIAPSETFQNSLEWFSVPEGVNVKEFWRSHHSIGKWVPFIEGKTPILDIGCGAGWPTLALCHFTDMIVGIDPSPNMIEFAERNRAALGCENARFHVAKAESIPYPDGFFKGVVMDNSLDLIEYQEQALREIWRVMEPGAPLALDCEWFDEVMGNQTVLEEQALSSDGKIPVYVYRKKTMALCCETEYVLYIDAASKIGQLILSLDNADSDLPPIEDIFAVTQRAIYFIAPHHTKESVSTLLSMYGFVDIQAQRYLVSCRKPD